MSFNCLGLLVEPLFVYGGPYLGGSVGRIVLLKCALVCVGVIVVDGGEGVAFEG